MAHRLIARESQHILSGWGIYIPVGEMGRPALMNELENLGCVILDRAPKQSEIPKKDDHEALNAMTSGWILVNNSKTHEMAKLKGAHVILQTAWLEDTIRLGEPVPTRHYVVTNVVERLRKEQESKEQRAAAQAKAKGRNLSRKRVHSPEYDDITSFDSTCSSNSGQNNSSSSSSSSSSSTSSDKRGGCKRRRIRYTQSDDVVLRCYVADHPLYEEAGNKLWQMAQRDTLLEERTWQSMRDRYLNYSRRQNKKQAQAKVPLLQARPLQTTKDPLSKPPEQDSMPSQNTSSFSGHSSSGCIAPPPSFIAPPASLPQEEKKKRKRKEAVVHVAAVPAVPVVAAVVVEQEESVAAPQAGKSSPKRNVPDVRSNHVQEMKNPEHVQAASMMFMSNTHGIKIFMELPIKVRRQLLSQWASKSYNSLWPDHKYWATDKCGSVPWSISEDLRLLKINHKNEQQRKKFLPSRDKKEVMYRAKFLMHICEGNVEKYKKETKKLRSSLR